MSEELQKKSLAEVTLPENVLKEIEEVIKEKRLSKEERERLIEETKKYYMKSKFEPGETVGIVAAQSISEPATQMCCDYDEKIIVKYPESIRTIKIGEFVDSILNKFGYERVDNYEVCDLPTSINFFVPSLNQNEKIEWKRIKACVRIKPKELIRIKTKSGRKITATTAHSFVIRKNNRIVPIAGSELKVGERIPVIRHLPENCNEFLNLNNVFNFIDQNDLIRESGFISLGLTVLPEKIRLDELFGFFVGAYLSDGHCTQSQVCVSNLNENFISPIRKLAEKFNLRYREFVHHRGFAWGRDLVINSTLLSRFFTYTCNTGSYNKKVPEFAYSASEEFVAGLLRGYFDGDGNVSVSKKMIRVHSNSEELIDGIKLLLTRFKIFAHKCKDKKQFYLLIPYKYAPAFLEKIGSDIKENRQKLKKIANLAKRFWGNKSQDFTDMISGFGNIFYNVAKKLRYPTRYINNFTKRQKIGRTTLYRYIQLFEKLANTKNIDIGEELSLMKRMLNSDVVWDEITEISRVKTSSDYVYDISVEGLETFTTFDGIITHNTMRTYHFAGSAGIKVTYGLPRLIEIFDAKKEPETPVMTIFLKKRFNNRETARRIAEEIVEKKILNVIKRISINLSEGSIEIEPLDLKRIGTIIKAIKENLKDVKVKVKAKKIVIIPKSEIDVRELQKIREKIMEIRVSGIGGITNVVIRREGEEWLINTIGSNLEEVLKIDEADETKTITNDIHEMAKIFGIEAARNLIINEALKTLQEQGLDVDIRHVMLVGDIMTISGTIKPIGRYGIAGAKTSILARAAFEETIKHLVRASVRNEVDNFQGIFENVMVGQVIPSGTGMFELIAKSEEEEK